MTIPRSPRGVRALARHTHVVSGGGGSSGVPTVAVKAFRNDGLTGTTRAVGAVQFAPGAVHASDLTNLTVWDSTDTEVARYVEDVGARHMGQADPTALLYAHVQVDAPFAALGSEPTYTVRFDRARTTSPLTKQSYSEFSNPLTLTLSSDNLKFRLNAAATAYFQDEDAPRRLAAADFVWSEVRTPQVWTLPINTPIAAPSSGYVMVRVWLTLDTDGTLRAYPRGTTTNIPGTSAPLTTPIDTTFDNDVHDNWGFSYVFGAQQILGYASVFIGPTASAWTPATSGLAATGITASLTASGTTKPFSVLPTGFPAATLTPSDATYLCATKFPGWTLTTSAAEQALGGTYASHDLLRYAGSKSVWSRGGSREYINNIAGTYYAYPLVEWMLFARTGYTRHYRRALGVNAAQRAWETNPTTGAFLSHNEANMDAVGYLVYYALTSPLGGATTDLSYAKQTLDNMENFQVRYKGNGLSGSTRPGMRVFAALPWYYRLGIDPGAMGDNGYTMSLTGSPGTDGDSWPEAASYTTATGAVARAQKMWSRYHNYMVSTAIGGAYETVANATSLRRLTQTDPGYHDVAPWMLGLVMSNVAFCAEVFGASLPLAQIATDMGDAFEFCYSATRASDGTPALYDQTAGAERFVYSLHNVIDAGVPTQGNGLNGGNAMLLHAFQWLHSYTGNAVWQTRGDTLYASQRASFNPGYYSKELSEDLLYASSWLAQRA